MSSRRTTSQDGRPQISPPRNPAASRSHRHSMALWPSKRSHDQTAAHPRLTAGPKDGNQARKSISSWAMNNFRLRNTRNPETARSQISSSDEEEDKRRSVDIAMALPPDYLDLPPEYLTPFPTTPTGRSSQLYPPAHSTPTPASPQQTSVPDHQARRQQPQAEVDWTTHFSSHPVDPPPTTRRWSSDRATLSRPFDADAAAAPFHKTTELNLDKLLPPLPPSISPVESVDLSYYYHPVRRRGGDDLEMSGQSYCSPRF